MQKDGYGHNYIRVDRGKDKVDWGKEKVRPSIISTRNTTNNLQKRHGSHDPRLARFNLIRGGIPFDVAESQTRFG